MCNWKAWIWPGIIASLALTALAALFHAPRVESELQAAAGDALAAHPWASVALDGRDLTLTGTAPDEVAQADAEFKAGEVWDVRVVNNLSDLLPEATPYVLGAVKGEGGLTLTGNVPNDAVRAAILTAAARALPGIAVNDKLVLARGMPEGFEALAAHGLASLANFTSGELSLSGQDLSVKGVASNAAAYDAALAARGAAIPAGGKWAAFDIVPPPADGPYRLVAVKESGSITVTGFAPSREIRAAILAESSKANPGTGIIDAIALASGAPDGVDWQAAGIFAISQLSKLTKGTANLTASVLDVTGEASDPVARETADQALSALAPAGLSVTAAITAPEADGDIQTGGIAKPEARPEASAGAQIAAAGPVPSPGEIVLPDLCGDLARRATGVKYVTFDTDKAEIKAGQAGPVEELLFVAQNCPALRFAIEGHTDSDANDAYNLDLSQRRANAIREYLVARGVAGNRVTAVGKGETSPVADNATEEGKALNRRIEIRLIQ
jgi:OOP family OmpA-OmpF porin